MLRGSVVTTSWLILR